MTTVVYTPDFLKHRGNPEVSARAECTYKYFKMQGIQDFIEPHEFPEKYMKQVHTLKYLTSMKNNSNAFFETGLFQNATVSASGCLTAGEILLKNDDKTAMVLNRPPGHHTHPDYGGGFCYLNNVAILAKYFQDHNHKKVMIIDWDAHHGDGTADIFYDDPNTLFCSIHQMPLYPGSGNYTEMGVKEGLGYTVNVPVPPDTGHATYIKIFKDIIVPIGNDFKPDVVLISSGLDSHNNDPLSSLTLSDRSYYDMTRCVKKLICDKIVTVLEGGYNIKNVVRSNYEIYSALSGIESKNEAIQHLPETDSMQYGITRTKHALSEYWNI